MKKLDSGDQLPEFTLTVGAGEQIILPQDINTDYAIILFYRGHWWPFCRRLLDGYEQHLSQFNELGVSIFAASSDSKEKADEVGSPLSFPVAWGVDRNLGDQLGAFWDERRDFVQPSEFLVNKAGKVLSSTYSSSPIGRTDPAEALVLIKFISSMKK
jgi:peroxiredoxin